MPEGVVGPGGLGAVRNQCTAKSLSTGKRCEKTPSKGKRVCRSHGASGGRPPIHGGRSKPALLAMDIATKAREIRQNPKLLDLDYEISELVAWYQQYKEANGQDPDHEEIRAYLMGIASVKERAHKMRYGEKYVITVEHIVLLAAQFADMVNRRTGFCPHCQTDLVEIRANIHRDIQKVLNRGNSEAEIPLEAIIDA